MRITFTTFIDFVVATPGSRVGVVRDARKLYDGGYQRWSDPYGGLRDGIVQAFREGRPPSVLRQLLDDAPEDMVGNWGECIAGLIKFLGRRKVMLRPRPKRVEWMSGGLSVKVNPELYVTIGGEPFLIKLHFKSEKLTKVRLNTMLYLMHETYPDHGTVGILDVRRGKLFSLPVPAYCAALLPGEAAAFVEIWRQLGGPTPQAGTAASS
jgi:hypothetical protein